MKTNSPRFCPVCGERRAQLRCQADGAITVARSPEHARARLPTAVGATVDGRYRVDAVIGRGAFGAVYAATQIATEQRVALKVLVNDTQGSRAVAEERFRKETKALGQLRHPATVRVYDVGLTDDGAPYFAMELIEGPNLEQVYAWLDAEGRTLSPPAIIDILVPILGSLAEAHALGLVHRDLKPANILLSRVADEGLVVKVVDFGVVRTEGSDLTGRSSTLGTPRYMSPEQCRGDVVDARADLYSVGCVLYEGLAGSPPFEAHSALDTMYLQLTAKPSELAGRNPQVSAQLDAIVRRVLAKDPKQRHATASELRTALETLRNTEFGDVPRASLDAIFGSTSAAEAAAFQSGVILSDQPTEAVPRQGTLTTPRPAPAVGAPPTNDPSAGGVTVIDLDADAFARAESGGVPDFRVATPTPSAGASPPRHLSQPTPAPWNDQPTPASGTDDGSGQSEGNALVRLPSPRELAAAIASRQKFLDERAAARQQADTRMELPEERQRLAQVAPPTSDDDSGRKRKVLGKGTLIGAGLPAAPRTPDDPHD